MINVACLMIHAAKIDEQYSDKEKILIKEFVKSYLKDDNINEILRNTTGIYSREEDGLGIFPNISLRGVNTLRSAQVNIMEDEINIMPAPYSAPDAYYFPITGKMNAVEILKGTSQYRYLSLIHI